ncbi:MAG: acylneuraminate cytidylyltransferase family protein [Candidatus Marinimicrobia bacterium]|jgi:CMP-N-acetylneuraminic acid synthetase|nr:acylneuraminate cytidylyltransferase family protein [Candidatus Neomarinimicrobiota bacterium]
MKYVALICARGGSKGLPGKNIKKLGGTPLIGWSIKVAKRIERVSRVIVSTDSEEIAEIALEYGAEVPFMRPKDLALDDSPEWLVWRHAINYLESRQGEKIEGLVVLPATAPLRSIEDVNDCIDEFEKGEVDSVITVSEANRSPYFNMIVNDKKGYSSLVIQLKKGIVRRQDAPKVYDMTTVAYVVNTNFVKKFDGIFEGMVKSVVVPPERAIDIDTMLDFKIAEYLILNR